MGHSKQQDRRQELIDCHDCGISVSFSASICPHCGSTQPAGPYVPSRREIQQHRIEQKNDQRLMLITLACCGLGIAYGALSGFGAADMVWRGLAFGFVGAVIGVPAAFIVNVSRNLFD